MIEIILLIIILLFVAFVFVMEVRKKNSSEDMGSIVEAADRGDAAAKKIIDTKYYGAAPEKLATVRKRIYLPKAEKGDNFSQYQMGLYYWLFENDPVQAEKWFIEAANGGNIQAMKYLANGYSEGFNDSGITTAPMGFGLDEQQEQKWWLQAANMGDEEAMYNVGHKYYSLRNYEAAESWFHQALKSKDCKIRMETYEWLGRLYGNMVVQEFYDEKKCKAMLLEALRQKNLQGIDTSTYDRDDFSRIARYLGERYENEYHYGTKSDKALRNAVYCYTLSYYTGDEDAAELIRELPYQASEAESAQWKQDSYTQNVNLPFAE